VSSWALSVAASIFGSRTCERLLLRPPSLTIAEPLNVGSDDIECARDP
jgi:hypothetical protein